MVIEGKKAVLSHHIGSVLSPQFGKHYPGSSLSHHFPSEDSLERHWGQTVGPSACQTYAVRLSDGPSPYFQMNRFLYFSCSAGGIFSIELPDRYLCASPTAGLTSQWPCGVVTIGVTGNSPSTVFVLGFIPWMCYSLILL